MPNHEPDEPDEPAADGTESTRSTRSRLEQLVAEGRVIPARRAKRPVPPPIVTAGTVSDLVAEQRR